MLAESYELNIAPRNYYSHLSSHIALHLCAVVPNSAVHGDRHRRRAVEDDLTGGAMHFEDGELAIPTAPGWGVDLDEDVARAHPWEPGRGPATWLPGRGFE